jgi:hypothetical protein
MTNMQGNIQAAMFTGAIILGTGTLIAAMRHHSDLGAISNTAIGVGAIASLGLAMPQLLAMIPGVQAAVV